jgi:pimeloyl-ACP methyl ester carboxylesterase
MQNFRKYGREPFKTAVIHGGPGAPGEMAPVAGELSTMAGILEPLQTAKTIKGQVEELKNVAIKQGNPPLTLIGWSWGAWLSYIFSSQYPEMVEKLILIASGPLEEKDAKNIMQTRLNRLNDEDRAKALLLINVLEDPAMTNKDDALSRLGKLISKADTYDPIPHESNILGYQYDLYQSVWRQASKLRSSGRLLEYGKKIQCPVIAIHGDFDPHPAEGVRRPLACILKEFRFILLERCGHTPWLERMAKHKFYESLRNELGIQQR